MSINVTPKEKLILDLLITRGLSNKQLARHLRCAESTVKMHVGHLLKKFGAKNRVQLVLFVQNFDKKTEL